MGREHPQTAKRELLEDVARQILEECRMVIPKRHDPSFAGRQRPARELRVVFTFLMLWFVYPLSCRVKQQS